MKKPIKAVMVEHESEFGQTAWYAVYHGTTPRHALEYYAYEMEIEGDDAKIEEVGDVWVLNGDEARAYEITIDTIPAF